MPMIATTIINSIRVKPLENFVRLMWMTPRFLLIVRSFGAVKYRRFHKKKPLRGEASGF
jgi:hypothetical protein